MKDPALLSSDPTNLIITGVGGQGNVLASRMIGEMLSQRGLHVTIGETFGASQRGGSVMSHLRISSESSFSPQIPKGRAHVVVSLEPAEALRVLKEYGNPEVMVICNTRPIHPIGVISGEQSYPSMEELKNWISDLSSRSWFIDATEAAMRLGNPVLGNIVSVGALAATKILPLDRHHLEAVLQRKMSPDKVRVNLTAFDIGATMILS
ncbi:MAG: indolepyruvate ferredoxin oxidoreductase [Desulfobacteraceae bacterium]|nr:MAG: indolepyruvate ferredoxin oxidoreductase [Desulfobacteraceae bacterium]